MSQTLEFPYDFLLVVALSLISGNNIDRTRDVPIYRGHLGWPLWSNIYISKRNVISMHISKIIKKYQNKKFEF